MKKYLFLFLVIAVWLYIFFWWYRDYSYYQNFQTLYNSWSFSELSRNNTIEKRSPQNYHNLGNTWYKIFEESTEVEDLKNAVWYYSWSLQIEEHPDTRYNYEFTRKLLEVLESQEQEEHQEQEETGNSENESQEGEESWEQEWSWEWNDESEASSWNQSNENTVRENRGEEYQIGSEDEVNEISEEEKALLEQELENIKNAQLYNQQFFWKQEQEWEFWNIFDSFFWRVDRGWKKDW